MPWFDKRLRSGRSARPTVVDWAHDPIGATPWARHASPYPDSGAVAEDAIHSSGVDPSEVEPTAVAVGVRRLVVTLARPLLAGDPAAVQALDAVSTRTDLDDALLWNLFTHHGARGIAARNHLVESVFDTGQAVEMLAGLIREGGFHVPEDETEIY